MFKSTTMDNRSIALETKGRRRNETKKQENKKAYEIYDKCNFYFLNKIMKKKNRIQNKKEEIENTFYST